MVFRPLLESRRIICFFFCQLQPQEISPPPTANLDRSNDKVYENVTGLVKAVIEMSSKIQPAPPEEYVPMVKVSTAYGAAAAVQLLQSLTSQSQT